MTTLPRSTSLRALALVGALSATALSAFAVDAVIPIPYSGLSLDDVATVNAAIKKVVSAQDPAAKAILDAHPNLKIVQANTAISPAPFNPGTHAGFVEIAKKGDIDLLFLGDSITDWWDLAGPQGGKNIYDEYFGKIKVADFAIAGDTTQGVLYRLQDGEGKGFQPKAIMLMIGTNNIGRNTAAEIADGVVADLNEIRKDFPEARILLLGVFPRGLPTDPARKTIADINAIISKLDDGKHIFYRDIGGKFLDANGVFLPGTFRPDNLHPVEAGYKIWAEAVKDNLASMLKGEAPVK